jgi:hypothetical protein
MEHHDELPSTSILNFLNEYKPTIRNSFDAVVIALHATFKKAGFKCVGCGNQDDETGVIISSLFVFVFVFLSDLRFGVR